MSKQVQFIPDPSVTHDPSRCPICVRPLHGDMTALKPSMTLSEI